MKLLESETRRMCTRVKRKKKRKRGAANGFHSGYESAGFPADLNERISEDIAQPVRRSDLDVVEAPCRASWRSNRRLLFVLF